jgi:Putative beta-barrel porin-2, OmpL-like. bbp2
MSRPPSHRYTVGIAASSMLCAFTAIAQAPDAAQPSASSPASSDAQLHRLEEHVTQLSNQVEDLEKLVRRLQEQLAKASAPAAAGVAVAPQAPNTPSQAPPAVKAGPASPAAAAPGVAILPYGVTINAMLDGYYEYNFNSPVGRVNNLRVYDVSSNSFSLSQADLLVESAPDIAAKKRWGMRLDLQFGQATSTLQGNAANEPHPDVYRNIWQAYGTYVFPVAKGLTVDFGKFESSLGIEGNYTKDQINYSRSLWYGYLPYYHMGFRSTLKIDDHVAVDLWIVNGTNQTEDFNSDKSALLGIVLTPTSRLSWTLNYYQGTEHPNVTYVTGAPPATATLPYQEGTYVFPIESAPDGKLQIADTYVTWQATKSLLLAAEADYARERLYSYSSFEHVDGGALYAAYQISHSIALAARAEYLADVGGLYTGITQHLKEATLTLDYRPADGFLVRGEVRRDESDQRYFLESTIGILLPQQTTVGLGLVWWFGQKQGSW